MSHTKTAIAAAMALTTDPDTGPIWMQAILQALRFAALAYLLWFIWAGPEPLEVRKVRRSR